MMLFKWLVWLVTMPIFTSKLRGRLRRQALSWARMLAVHRKVKRLGCDFLCGSPMKLTRHTEIGDHVALMGVTASGNGRLVFGDYVRAGEGLLIYTRNHNYHGLALPYDTTYVPKDVIVDDLVWIGARVILLPGTHIGEGAIIQAGSVVHGEIPPLAIAGGNPAKVFAWRDKTHYERLKSQRAFQVWR